MAIRIPILTSFDPKGLKQANASFAKLGGSINSLGRNFAVAGVAIGAIGAGLAKTVQTASSYAESVNAVNVAFGKSAQGIIDFGKTAATTLGVSQVDFNNAAVRFSAFAERIVGSGGDASKFIGEISTRASDFASVFNIEVSEALQVFQSGLAGEAEPLKRFGINLLDSEVKAYAAANGIGAVGAQLTETEKVQARYGLLMQATSKTSGDFANTSDGLANQLRILKAEVSNTQIEIGNQLLPVMSELLPVVRDLVRDLGTQLVAAVKAVDWKSLITDLMNIAKFFIENATAIAQVTVAIFAVNTAYKTLAVVTGIAKVATDLYKWSIAQAAAGTTVATVATTAFSTALKLIPFVAIAAGLALVVAGIMETDSSYRTTTPVVTSFGQEILKTGHDAKWAAGQYGILKTSMEAIPKNISTTITISTNYASNEARRFTEQAFGRGGLDMSLGKWETPTETGTGSGTKGLSGFKTLKQTLAKQAKIATKGAKLLGKGLSAGLVSQITGGKSPIKTANKVLKKIAASGGVFAKKIQKLFNRTKAGQDELTASAEEAAAKRKLAKEEAEAADAEAAKKEADALAERERVYNSFLDSVKSTFANIKDSIMGAFDITQLGGSTDSIIRNMGKLLEKTKGFASNISQLSTMGLDPLLLQQVIQAGPMAGAQLAASLVAGGASGLSQINAGYAEFGSLASQIATTGTNAAFGTAAQQNIYNIEISGGVGSGATIGKAIVDAIKAYERTSGAVWQGA